MNRRQLIATLPALGDGLSHEAGIVIGCGHVRGIVVVVGRAHRGRVRSQVKREGVVWRRKISYGSS